LWKHLPLARLRATEHFVNAHDYRFLSKNAADHPARRTRCGVTPGIHSIWPFASKSRCTTLVYQETDPGFGNSSLGTRPVTDATSS
jgi:hypothetical protein